MRRFPGMILCLVLFAAPAAAESYESAVDHFFQQVAAGQSVQAVDDLYASNPWLNAKSDAIVNLKNQLAGVTKLVGDYRGKEKIAEYRVGTHFVYLAYMALYDRQPLRFVFEFYKPENAWRVFYFAFDDKLDDDLEDHARHGDWAKGP